MGYEVWTTKMTYLSGVRFNNKAQLMDAIEETKKDISRCKEKLKALAYMTEPKKFYSEDDPMFDLDRDLNELFEEYETSISKLDKLYLFEEAWNETHDIKTGKTILPVNPLNLKKCYMGGSMDEILEDGTEVPEDYWDVYLGFKKIENSSFADKLKQLKQE